MTWQSLIWQLRLVGLKQCRLTGKITADIRFHAHFTEIDRTEGIFEGMQTLKGSLPVAAASVCSTSGRPAALPFSHAAYERLQRPLTNFTASSRSAVAPSLRR